VGKQVVVLSRDYPSVIRNETDKAVKVKHVLLAVKEIKAQLEEGRLLVKPLQSWMYKCIKIATCVYACHDGDAPKFVQNTPTLDFRGTRSCCNNINHREGLKRNKKVKHDCSPKNS
jgi:hypothetical protein